MHSDGERAVGLPPLVPMEEAIPAPERQKVIAMLKKFSIAAVGAAVMVLGVPAYAVDADAALALARQNNCLKCHAIDKDKDGPSYKKVAEKYKGK